MTTDHISSNVRRIYDEVAMSLTLDERLRLIEMLTKTVAAPEPASATMPKTIELPVATLPTLPGWHITERRGEQSDWRDRAL
jgi:hypothetical protein